jgi:ABC-type multidrug transport system ATPase subunit
MIAFDRVSAGRAPRSLANVTLEWGAGVHSIVGRAEDGGPLVLVLMARGGRLRAGSIRVLDGAPGDGRTRKRVAHVPIEAALPDGLRVDEMLDVATTLRGDPPADATERLAALGIEMLARRSVRSLSHGETRAVALVEALTSRQVRVVLIEEPLSAIDGRAAGRLAEALRAKARTGCAVVFTTSSLRDAGELASDHVMMQGGAVIARVPSLETWMAAAPAGTSIVILVQDGPDARAVSARLAAEMDVSAVEHEGPVVRARGREPLALARAAGRAALDAGVVVLEIRIESPSLEDARIASAGIAAAAYERARPRVPADNVPTRPAVAEPEVDGPR